MCWRCIYIRNSKEVKHCMYTNSGIQLLGASVEPEQVFHVKKILNHPFYQPNRVGTLNLAILIKQTCQS